MTASRHQQSKSALHGDAPGGKFAHWFSEPHNAQIAASGADATSGWGVWGNGIRKCSDAVA